MNLKRAFIIALAACVLPGAALAQDLGTEVRFNVQKWFTDGNTESVMVKLECNDGFVSQDGMAEISPDKIGHTFIVTGLTPFAPVICSVTEGDSTGYGNWYYAWSTDPGNDSDDDADMCEYYFEGRVDTESDSGSAKTEDGHVGENAIRMGFLNSCLIKNYPDPVAIEVTKEWDVTNGNDSIDFYAMVDVWADAEIEGGYPCPASTNSRGCKTLTFIGQDPAAQSVMVTPESYKGTMVYLSETVEDSWVETENDCGGSVSVAAGDTGESCAFTNSVFFEGIPTLSQYGMAIMALLMLGMGFVGFRRFV